MKSVEFNQCKSEGIGLLTNAKANTELIKNCSSIPSEIGKLKTLCSVNKESVLEQIKIALGLAKPEKESETTESISGKATHSSSSRPSSIAKEKRVSNTRQKTEIPKPTMKKSSSKICFERSRRFSKYY